MATIITTSTQATPLGQPTVPYIDRDPVTGHLWAMIRNTAGNYELFRSTNGGTTWVTNVTLARANVQEIGPIHIDQDGQLFWAYRTYESTQDRIYLRQCDLSASSSWRAETLMDATSAGSAGAVYQGMDLQSVDTGNFYYVVVAVGTTLGTKIGATLLPASVSKSSGVVTANAALVTGKRQWAYTGSGRITPSLDIEHYGDAKRGNPAHLWLLFGRTDMYLAKLPWNGNTWTGPSAPVLLATVAAQDAAAGRWDGQRYVAAFPNPASTSTVLVVERNRANSISTQRVTGTHTTGVVRNCTITYDSTSGNPRVFAVGTATQVLYYTDFVRTTGLWSSWVVAHATATIGTAGNQYSARLGTAGNARFDIVTAHATPNQQHSQLGLSFPPNTPTWVTASGAAYDSTASLVLTWAFSDPDPTDVQQSYAVSRQIGAGALAYWRASDSTWQVAEVQNVSATQTITVASWSTGPTEATHTYRVKTWDTTPGVASAYSDPLAVIPSQLLSPTITAPTAASTISTNQVTITWTVGEESAYRVQLAITAGATVYDSGWITGSDLTYTPPSILDSGGNYTITLQTKNNEGLASAAVTRQFFVVFVPPASPTLVATPVPASGWISVAATNPPPVGAQPTLVNQDLYRRPVGSYSTVLNANPDFETDLNGWQASSASTITRDNTRAHSGTWSMKVTPNGAGANAYGELTIAAMPVIDQTIPYVGSAWIWCTTANKSPTVWLHWWTSANAYIVSSFAGVPAVAGTWIFVTVVANPPVTAGKVAVAAGVDGSPAIGDTCWADQVTLTANDAGLGTRVAASLSSGATFNDWRVPSLAAVEYRLLTRGSNGTSGYGAWTA